MSVCFLRTFEDGFPNLFIPNAHGIRGQHVAFLSSFSSPGVIFEQLSVIYALPKLFVASFTLVLPFFPTGTSERMEDEGDVATAFTLARILSNIPISRGGPTSLVIFDIHALQVCSLPFPWGSACKPLSSDLMGFVLLPLLAVFLISFLHLLGKILLWGQYIAML